LMCIQTFKSGLKKLTLKITLEGITSDQLVSSLDHGTKRRWNVSPQVVVQIPHQSMPRCWWMTTVLIVLQQALATIARFVRSEFR
jgi:hypothetical protein